MSNDWFSRSLAIKILFTLLAGMCLALTMGQGCAPSPPSPPAPAPPGQFVGAQVTADESQGCQRCHSNHYDSWVQTNHDGALETLKAIGQGTNPACIVCHTVGFGQDGGFVDEATTARLAGVQCENCHGPGRDHVNNVDVVSLRPPTNIAAAVCGKCHNGSHHPTFDEWSSSAHALVTEDTATSFAAGTSLSTCGVCHSGDYRKMALIEGVTPVPDDLLKGKTRAEMNAVTCVICHDPHARTGNAVPNNSGEDFQLRYPEVTSPTPSNTLAIIFPTVNAANPIAARYNLCGQCHHSRDATWTKTTRGPHHSIQSNMYLGEMPLPDNDQTLLVPNIRSVHRFVPKQCATCHLSTEESEVEDVPSDSGHKFLPNLRACAAVGCHPTPEVAQADMTALQTQVQARLDSIAARLGDPATWQYSAEGGPADQSTVSDDIKKIRFLYDWVINDGSKGVHNPEYTRTILTNIDNRLTALGK